MDLHLAVEADQFRRELHQAALVLLKLLLDVWNGTTISWRVFLLFTFLTIQQIFFGLKALHYVWFRIKPNGLLKKQNNCVLKTGLS